MTASSATLSTWKRDAPATLFPQQDTCSRELGATDFLESGALEKQVEADRRRSRSEVWFNRFARVAKVSDSRETRQVFIEAIMQCKLFDLTLQFPL
jgi:hypothetical protein